jgi:hypothetical protein
LLIKLQYYGVHGSFLQWFKSYFQYRKQRVELKYTNNKYFSGWELVHSGVPQGSVLGPLLFNIYINYFPLEISKISEVIMFADDTSILCTSKDYNNLKMKLDDVCSHMSTWFQANFLALNLDKTKIIKFTSTILTDYPLKTLLLNTVLKTAVSTTCLGLQLDNHLTCKAHVISYSIN